MRLPIAAALRTAAAAALAGALAVPAIASEPGALGLALDAWGRGDFETAARELAPLAAEGGRGAQYFLGRLYATGRGVARDPVTAVMWLDLSATAGFPLAPPLRDAVAATLTAAERDESARRAAAWSAGRGR